jgi:hypothetical protein
MLAFAFCRPLLGEPPLPLSWCFRTSFELAVAVARRAFPETAVLVLVSVHLCVGVVAYTAHALGQAVFVLCFWEWSAGMN